MNYFITRRLFVFFFVLYLLSFAASLDTSQCDRVVQRGDGLVCYKAQLSSNTFTRAQSICQQSDAMLAKVTSEAEDAAVVDILKMKFMSSMWLEMKQRLTPWSWSDRQPLMEQGCHHKDHITPFTTTTTLTSPSPTTCLQHCSQKNFPYAALNAGNECSCSSSIHTTPHNTAQCNISCISNPAQNCGGVDSYRVLAVNGSYSSWTIGRPSNSASNDNIHSCALLLIDPSTSPLPTWLDVSCDEKFKTICQIELNTDFPTCDTSINNVHSLTSPHKNTCVFINHSPLNFFEATKMCGEMNGIVVDVSESEVNVALGTLLGDEGVKEFWIGANKFKQQWTDGTPLTYSNWQDLNYQQLTLCGSVQRSTTATISDHWKLLQCDADVNVICETSNSTHFNKATFFRTTLASTTPGPVTKLTNLFISTTLPPINITILLNTQANSNLVKWTTLGGILGGLLLLVLLAVVVIVVILKKKHKLPTAKADLEAKKSIFVEPTYFFGATIEKETTGAENVSCADSGKDCGSMGGGNSGGVD